MLKQQNPGRWDENTDEEVGLVHIKLNATPELFQALPPSDYENLPSLDSSPFFAKWGGEHLDHQIRHIAGQYQKEMSVRGGEFNLAHQDEKLRQIYQNDLIKHAMGLLQAQVAHHMVKLAATFGLDVPRYVEWRVKVMLDSQEVAHKKALNELDLDKMRRQFEYEREHLRAAKEIEDEYRDRQSSREDDSG